MSESAQHLIPVERTLHGALGMELFEQTGDVARGRLPVEDRVLQPYGIVHGGSIMALAETITSAATALEVVPQGKVAMGQEINGSFMRPISKGHVNAAATVRRRGRTAWNWEVEVTDDDGRLCALIRITIAVRDSPSGGDRVG